MFTYRQVSPHLHPDGHSFPVKLFMSLWSVFGYTHPSIAVTDWMHIRLTMVKHNTLVGTTILARNFCWKNKQNLNCWPILNVPSYLDSIEIRDITPFKPQYINFQNLILICELYYKCANCWKMGSSKVLLPTLMTLFSTYFIWI